MIARGAFERLGATLRTRAALGLRPATTPVMVFVPLGVFLGPLGVGALTPRVLDYLDAVVSIALATIGVFVGIAVGARQGYPRRLVAASTAEGLVTVLFVAGAVLFLLLSWGLPLALSPALAALALGMAAAASAAPFAGETANAARRIAAGVADLDDVLPIVAGGVVLSLCAADQSGVLHDLLITAAVGLGAGIGGWLLFERSEGAERGVFVVGMLALLGGAAAFAATSPLLAGMVAGIIWVRTPGHTDRIAAADLRKVEHPLVVLLLIVTGAGLQPTPVGIWLLIPLVLFRTTGKLLGGWVASRVAPGVAPADLGAYLLPPGALGIGFVLNLQQVAPASAGPLVFAVAAGAIISELAAVIVTPPPAAA